MDARSPTALHYPELVGIFEEVFQHTDTLSAATSSYDIERWDSLQHIALIRSLEVTFGVRLSMDEMMEIRSVGDIENVLRRHGV
ncbi:MAG: acyl carrier protein [Hyphomicrobium sp.]|uniref:acyl carrier protein n=1 Tax=Hyphomicrobium sp. TaxID=82 RepID=UPI00132324AC|nr:acyl carrier protein [Hyphomicrobium sp.]KAB2943139.1 MAG: acyl carrier protein [Hyphomicrobium sp.]MBZ0209032.1 acyl carrier protein [Hyphomicrobium sp.]MCZ7594167.1 acyl carrier protein [Hyphomicrobium sp.]